MRHLAFFLLFNLIGGLISAQESRYWIQFTDKEDTPYSISNPEAFLSEKALQRRAKSGLIINEQDLPVNPSNVDEIAALDGVQVHHRSKWFNAVSISSADSTLLPIIMELPFVQNAEQVKSLQKERINFYKWSVEKTASETSNLINQLEMIGLHQMHQIGFRGEGIDIAVFDSGFTLADALPALHDLWNDNRVKGTYDLYDGDNWVFHHQHGTFVLSILAGNQNQDLIGSAPKANYYLFRTEVAEFENRLEEDNWVVAAEKADSLGVDIINSSLGYSNFDEPEQSYTYADMNGVTTRISQVAHWASERGMLVVCSAGNQGSGSWKYITAPADADGVLTVGAVNSTRDHAPFSSFGPTSDGRLKPNLVAQGQATAYAALDGTIRTGNGTSFSAPIISGAAACLMQAHPELSSFEVLELLEEHSHLFNNPNDSLGNGIPDFFAIHDLLSRWETSENSLLFFPNPTSAYLNILLPIGEEQVTKLEVYNVQGSLVLESKQLNCGEEFISTRIDTQLLTPGTYTLRLGSATKRFVKIQSE